MPTASTAAPWPSTGGGNPELDGFGLAFTPDVRRLVALHRSEQALIAALKSGTILAAGLDVFANEPTVPDELKAMKNVVLFPHLGSASVYTRNAMDQLVADNLNVWFAGQPPLARW